MIDESYPHYRPFPSDSHSKESDCNAGDLCLILLEGNGNPLQYSCLENPMDRGAWQATVHGVTKSRTGPIMESNIFYTKSLDLNVNQIYEYTFTETS